MNQMTIFEEATGQQLRDDGMKRVESNNATWAEDVVRSMLADFALLPDGCLFTGEDFHQWLDNRNFRQPTHPNAWAAVIGSQFRKWLRSGKIEHVGAVVARRSKAHSRLIRLYKKAAL